MRKSKANLAFGARALLIYAVLCCLLFSDGVGPRLIPYPSQEPKAASSYNDSGPELFAQVHTLRERALISLSLKLGFFKLDRTGKQQADSVLGASPVRAAILGPDALARRGLPRPRGYTQPSARAHAQRGPPELS
jgi:hypothetical protein